MTWCNNNPEPEAAIQVAVTGTPKDNNALIDDVRTITCPSCGHHIQIQSQQGAGGGGGGVEDLAGLPAGVKFDPSDQEILQHLEAKILLSDTRDFNSLIDEFIPTIEGDNGICYTHPQKLPGVNKDGQVRHFFHRPSKAYTTGTRKRRRVHRDEDGSEKRWHKTGKTRPLFIDGTIKGFKKILVLYTNYGRQRKPEKTNWVMHQYHLGNHEEETDGELVVSKVFYQTQQRQCGSAIRGAFDRKLKSPSHDHHSNPTNKSTTLVDYYNPSSFIGYDHGSRSRML